MKTNRVDTNRHVGDTLAAGPRCHQGIRRHFCSSDPADRSGLRVRKASLQFPKNSETLISNSFSDLYENQCFLNDEKSWKATTTKGDLKLYVEQIRK